MWADNETRIDLLGFDYLVDTLEVVLTQPRLLPVTVGVLGDWGSGKTSLLHMVADRLDDSSDYVIVPFSPWRYEAYEDVKAALMAAVLDKLAQRAATSSKDDETNRLLGRLWDKVARLMVLPKAAARVALPTAGSLLATHQGLPAEAGKAAGDALVAAAQALPSVTSDGSASASNERATFESVSDFRDEFEALLENMPDVRATIVLIDDLDRCLDDTVIDVFEAIRLFLQVSRTAFVIAANRPIVQAAVERRFPAKVEGDPALGKDYLEKIIQIEINVPALAEPEAETYLNLLFAELRLDAEQCEAIRAEAVRRRHENQFSVAMNYGIAKGVLGEIPAELEADFTIANRIAPTLSRGLRGNPRQLKRFLNTMLLRMETARRRGVTLDPGVLAKLMVLEQQQPEFEQLFLWQLAQHGAPEEVRVAEEAVMLGAQLPKDASTSLQSWFGSPAVQQWLGLEPRLSSVPLGQYFFFSRDRLSPAAPSARLSAPLQAVLGRLQLEGTAQRRTAVDEAAQLGPEEYTSLYDALLERAKRKPGGAAMDSVIELTDKVPTSWPALAAMLQQIPAKDIPPKLPLALKLVGKNRPEITALFEQWAGTNVTRLKNAVRDARGETR